MVWLHASSVHTLWFFSFFPSESLWLIVMMLSWPSSQSTCRSFVTAVLFYIFLFLFCLRVWQHKTFTETVFIFAVIRLGRLQVLKKFQYSL